MHTYLITWNPKRFVWNLKRDLRTIRTKGFLDGSWSCGNTKSIEQGDRVYLLRQGIEPRGIMGSGVALSRPYQGEHWDRTRPGEPALFIDVRFDALLDAAAEGVLPLWQLRKNVPSVHWNTQASGISISPEAAAQIERLWISFLESRGQSPVELAEEIATPQVFFEGATRTIRVNAYERDPRARAACIKHYGASCFICGVKFAAVYGPLGEGFIHVHHVMPLSKIGKRYQIDPVRHLRPVCPNCHAMLHRRPGFVIHVEKLRKIVQKHQPQAGAASVGTGTTYGL